jgi:hypothetical protein
MREDVAMLNESKAHAFFETISVTDGQADTVVLEQLLPE